MNVESKDIKIGGNLTGGINSNNRISIQFQDVQNKRPALANWVSELDFSRHQSQALEKRTTGTLGWVFEDPNFSAWFEAGKGGMIWAPGKPGAGKTTFASFVIDYLQKASDKDPQAVAAVCYIYCRYYTTLTVLQMFEVILKQLILCCPSLELDDLQKLKDQSRRLSVDDIIVKLKDWSSRIPNIFIVIDAFDECFSEDTRHQVLCLLQSLGSLKILITSRPLPSIESAMVGVPRVVISARGEDIRIYFQAHTRINGTLARLASKVSDVDVEAKIIDKADGMFLLASLHTSHLATQTSTKELVRALETLPKEATGTYGQTLDRIRQQHPNRQRLAFHTFAWIFDAFRPFKLTELRHALAIAGLDQLPEEEDLDDEESIISSCAGLIVVDASQTVRFLHYTFQEYLQQTRTGSNFLPEVNVAITSLKVLSLAKSNPLHCPLLQYAASAWGLIAQKWEYDESVLTLILSQLLDLPTVGLISNTEPDSSMSMNWGRSGARAVHLIAVFGLLRTAKAFLESYSGSFNERDNSGRTALICAAINGHLDVVKLLLTRPNVNINASDNVGGTALSWAVENGYIDIVKELLTEPKLDVNTPDRVGLPPLWRTVCVSPRRLDGPSGYVARSYSRASSRSNVLAPPSTPVVDPPTKLKKDRLSKQLPLEIIKLLLADERVDPNVIHKSGRTLLLWAAYKGHLAVAELLATTPNVDINVRCKKRGLTALLWAAEKGSLPMVNFFLETGRVELSRNRQPSSAEATVVQDAPTVNLVSQGDPVASPSSCVHDSAQLAARRILPPS